MKRSLYGLIGVALLIGVNAAPVFAATANGTLDQNITSISTVGREYFNDVFVASNGDVYLTGVFDTAIDLDPTAGTDTHTPVGGQDSFVTKINADGSYGWSHSWGSSGLDVTYEVMVSSANIVYVTGYISTGNTDFNAGGGGDIVTVTGSTAGYIMRLQADGTYIDADILDGAATYAVDEDSVGNIIVGGAFSGTVDFDFEVGTTNAVSNGQFDGFVAKYSSSMGLGFVRSFGGSAYDYVQAVRVDSEDNIIYGGGFTQTADFDPTAGTFSFSLSNASYGGYITKLTSAGAFVFAKPFGGTGYTDAVTEIEIDSNDNIVMAGYISNTADLDADNAGGEHTATHMEVVLAKYGSAGAIQFSSIHPSNEIVNTTLGLGIDSLDRIYISSDAKAGTQDFNPGPGVDNLTVAPQLATYVSRITQAGDYDGSFVFEGQASGTVVPSEIFVTGSGTIYIAGSNGGSGDVDINPGAGAVILSPNGDLNGFAASYTMASSYGITGLGSGYSVVDASTGTEIAANSIPAGTTKQVRLLKDGVPIALIDITFDSDSIWTSVSGDSDRTTGRAVVDGFGSVIGAASTHGLYVPRGEADTQVTICPNVTSLAEVDASCSNPETFVASDDNVQIVSLGGNSYWLVTGLSGTGGFTIAAEAVTSTFELVETGTNLILYPFLGVVIVTATVALKRFSR